ncbi:MAG: glutamine amidotransferase, partial [Pirellulales bacterium]|nr:glutamine amidotransferase [Pirellulales bacterium]
GGENSFGPGGYHRTAVEESLPVTMDITKKKILPKGALAIVLHTCEFPQGNTWGKRITKQAIRVLGSQDEVGVLVYAFDGAEKWLFPLTPAGEYEQLVPKINGAQIGDMPSFQPTMELGLEGLVKSDAATKHMIIISDGDPSPPTPALIRKYRENKISISMVAIFPHGGEDISKMRAVAGVTGGRYYFPSDPAQLPSIFVKESKTLRRSMIQNRTLTPEVSFPSSIVRGIDTVPPLHGFVLTTPKDRAETVLRAPLEEDNENQLDPILATWRYGLATTAAFTSDLSTNWCADWVNWERYRAFVKQMLTKVARVRKPGNLNLWTISSASEGTIVVEDFHPEESFLDVRARVTGPREQTKTIQLEQIAPRRYQANLELWGKGRYHVMVEGSAGERKDFAHGGMIVSYSPEYLRFRSRPQALEDVWKSTGGEALDPNDAGDVIFGRREP